MGNFVASGDGQTLIGTPNDDTLRSVFNRTSLSGGTGNDFLETDFTISSESQEYPYNYTFRIEERQSGDDGDDVCNINVHAEITYFSVESVIDIDGGFGNDDLTVINDSYGSRNCWAKSSLFGGAGYDRLFVDTRADAYGGGGGADARNVLDGGADSDILIAYASSSDLEIGGAENLLDGGTGDDHLIASASSSGGDSAGSTNTLDGGRGNDLLEASANSYAQYGAYSLNELLGGEGDDELLATALASALEYAEAVNKLDGGYGDDRLTATAGLKTYIPESAKIENTLGDGNDTLHATILAGSPGRSILYGGAGNDTLTVVGGSGNILDGGAGNDTYVISGTGNALSESTSGAYGGTDSVLSSVTWTLSANLENLNLTGTAAIDANGNALANVLIGNAAANLVSGGSGNDTLDGGAGNDNILGGLDNDRLAGGAGNDTLGGGLGNDVMDGGAGNDAYVIDAAGDAAAEAVAGAAGGTDLVQAAVGHALSANLENLTLTGTAAIAGSGNDWNNAITGNAAANNLSGFLGNDTLTGGAGNDTLVGGLGADSLVGGLGSDVFDFNFDTQSVPGGRDTIRGFDGAGVSGGDRVDLASIDANLTRGGNQAFTLGGIGTGQVSLVTSGANTLLRGNTDADAAFEIEILIADGAAVTATTYTATDFVL